jgi:hypothetical protein
VEFQDFADGVIEHEEAGGLLDRIGWLGNVDEVEDGGEDFIHPLHVLDLRVQFGIDIQNPGHVIVAVGPSLLGFISQELLVSFLTLAVNQLELLPSRTREVGNHDLSALVGEEAELSVGSTRIFLDLLPEQVVLLELLVSRVLLFQQNGMVLELLFRQEQLDKSLVSSSLLVDRCPPLAFF